MTYTVVVLRKRGGPCSVSVPALPGCHTWGESLPHAVRMVEEAMQCHLESLQAHGDPIPPDTSTFEVDMGDATDAVIYKVTVPPPAPVP